MRFNLTGTALLATTFSIAFAIRNKQNEPMYMVAVTISDGATCSGFLVAPDRVITARHCTPATYIRYGSAGPDFPKCIKVARYKADKMLDAAVLYLAEPVRGITPIRISLKDQCQKGNTMTIYGFGSSSREGSGAGVLRSMKATVTKCKADHIQLRGYEKSELCKGDSGGAIVNENEEAVGISTEGLDSAPKFEVCGPNFQGPKLSSIAQLLYDACAHCSGVGGGGGSSSHYY